MKASERLTAALIAAKAPQPLIDKARGGYYGDFTSPLATPQTQLYIDAKAAGLTLIMEGVKRGDYDGD